MKKTNDMKKKWYTLGEITDEFVGVKSAPEREAFDADVEAALIGASIKNARKAMNLTQAQLGERVGVQTAQISKIESGRNLTISTIVRVLKALGLSANFSINCEGLTPVTLGNRI
jgi:DNA-binding XRE family transcriptional regulator